MSHTRKTLDDFKPLVQEFNENFKFFKGPFSKSSISPNFEVNGTFPIVWFGDLNYYLSSAPSPTIVTIGANPSNAEFSSARFSKNKRGREAMQRVNNITTDTMDEEISFFNEYFTMNNHIRTPYFTRLEETLNKALFNNNEEYKGYIQFGSIEQAPRTKIIHIDAFSAVATTPLWGKLKSDSNTPTIADILTLANKNTPGLFNRGIDSLSDLKYSGHELESRLLELLDPDITVFMGTFNYFEQKIVYDFIKDDAFKCYSSDYYAVNKKDKKDKKPIGHLDNSKQNHETLSEMFQIAKDDYQSANSNYTVLQPSAAVYVKQTNDGPKFLLFKRNAQSNLFFSDELAEAVKNAKDSGDDITHLFNN